MQFKKLFASLTAGALMLGLMACGNGSSGNAEGTTVIQVGFENSISEPIGQGLERWQELVEQQSGGTLKLELFPDSKLGSKLELINSMLLGEPVLTLADGAFYADYGVPDFGIVFGPFLFDDWEECWKLVGSDWYKEQCRHLEGKGLKIVSSNWIYGDRHILTARPVNTVDDLKGLKIRIPDNHIQLAGFETLDADVISMDLDNVYHALRNGDIDGAENPLSTLYGLKLHEAAQYLILDGHVKNFTTLVMSSDLFHSLTPEQQDCLVSTCEEAGLYNNEIQQASEMDYLEKMKDEGVTVVIPSEEVLDGFREKALPFYEQGHKFGWSDGLYETVCAAIGK